MIWLALSMLALLLAMIWYLGTGRFGRAQTQAWIDRAHKIEWLHRLLNRHHGKFRAAMHYLEFGGLFLVLYWVWNLIGGDGRLHWHTLPAVVIALVCVAAAYLDEVHQLRSGTRQFRREDFLHSCCGITLAAAIIMWQHAIRFFGL